MVGARIAVTDDVTEVAAQDVGVSGSLVFITNTGAHPVDLGGADVATGAGYPLANGASMPWPLQLGSAGSVYAVCASSQETTLSILQG